MSDSTDVAVAVPPASVVQPTVIDVGPYVEKYIKIRDKISEIKKRHEEELRPYVEAKGALDGLFGEQLTKTGALSMRTPYGTITASERGSATVEDMQAFRAFVTQMGEWDLVDFRANAPAVKQYGEDNKQLPPGVKYTAIYTISVRRAS